MTGININALAGVAPEPGPYDLPANDLASRDTFLRLLTTQLQNQDPTSPMQNEEFLSQLAQFSSLEQLMGLQGTLQAVYAGIEGLNSASMANLLGTDVVARGNQVRFDGESPIDLAWKAPAGTVNGKVTITDEAGKVVRVIEVGALGEEGSVSWDGRDRDGNLVRPGTYTFSVTGSDSQGNPVTVQTRIHGTITGMDYSQGFPQPSINGVPIDLGDILTLTTGKDKSGTSDSN
jgi:flagellar basal-body rod modification protein FlgD